MSEQTPLGDREHRPGIRGILRWLRVAFVIAWVLSVAFALSVFILGAQEAPIDWLQLLSLIVLGCAMLPFGLFILRRVEAVLARSSVGADVLAESSRTRTRGRTERLLTGLFGLVLVVAGLVGGLRRNLYEGRDAGIRSVDAPITAWILGVILIIVGLCLIAAVLFKTPEDRSDQ